MNKLEAIIEDYPDGTFLIADGFDDCIIGVCEQSMRIIYSVNKCIDNLMTQDMDALDACEYFEYNVAGSYVGEHTPIWCYDNYDYHE